MRTIHTRRITVIEDERTGERKTVVVTAKRGRVFLSFRTVGMRIRKEYPGYRILSSRFVEIN